MDQDLVYNSTNSTKTEIIFDTNSQEDEKEKSNYRLGIVYSIFYGISLGAMFILQKLGQDVSGINVLHMLIIRQVCILLGGYIHGKLNDDDHSNMGWKQFKRYPQELKRLIYLRCVIDWIASVLVIFAVMLIPVSLTVSVSRLSVFFTPLLAFIIDNEKVTKYEICTIAGGFLGVLMIMNPSFFDSSDDEMADIQERAEKDKKKYPYYYVGLIMTVLFAIVAAVGVVYVRVLNKCSVQRVPPNLQVYYYGIFTTGLVVIASIFLNPGIFAFWNLF